MSLQMALCKTQSTCKSMGVWRHAFRNLYKISALRLNIVLILPDKLSNTLKISEDLLYSSLLVLLPSIISFSSTPSDHQLATSFSTHSSYSCQLYAYVYVAFSAKTVPFGTFGILRNTILKHLSHCSSLVLCFSHAKFIV